MPLQWMKDVESNYANKNYKDFSLGKILSVLQKLGNPHEKIKNIIHVAGTNGKWSVCTMICEILYKSGYTVNLFTSPHIIRINERISLNNQDISDEKLATISQEIKQFCNDLSFFEVLTVIAIVAFAKYSADFAIFEVGLGGRLDSTNIFPTKLASVITSISLDHQQILGNTIEKIAYEKAGIINNSEFTIFANNQPNILQIFKNEAKKANSKLLVNKNDFYFDENCNFFVKNEDIFLQNVQIGLKGKHQKENAALAIILCKILSTNFPKISKNTIKNGVFEAKSHGRLQELSENELKLLNLQDSRCLVDCAHNIDGITKLSHFVKENSQNRRKIAIFTQASDKVCDEISKIIVNMNFSEIFIVNIENNHRIANADIITEKLRKNNGQNLQKVQNIQTALTTIAQKSDYDIYIFGSIFLVGKFFEVLDDLTVK